MSQADAELAHLNGVAGALSITCPRVSVHGVIFTRQKLDHSAAHGLCVDWDWP